ncbi:hypothetical protein AQUCO_02800261v1 [Aquilegia coerulea]|uniref:Cytochrome P450 n=1 Tax=Aquilegia coerulea TaxID=218851 RepID=A0A2G5D4I6_AQUCA|nr:hypothetical protein AQUCO_02800261v1 [Aquilegia coerulea]
MEMTLTIFSLVFTFLLSLFMLRVNSRSKIKWPPGPRKLPLIGNLHNLQGIPHHTLRNLAREYGPLMYLQLGQVPMIVVSSPRVAKEVLKTQDPLFADRPDLLAAKIGSYNYKGIVFSPFGKYWRQMRKICFQELFSAKKVQSMWSIREEEVSNLIEKVSAMAGTPVNLSQMLSSLANDITARAAFGKKCKEKDKEAFLALMKESMRLAGGFDFADLYPSLTLLHGINGKKLKLEEIRQKLDKILEGIINEHKEKRTIREIENNPGYVEDVLDVILRLQEENNLDVPVENDNIKAVIQDIFVGGSDTSSTTVIWALSEMMKTPKILEKAQNEVRKVFNGKAKIDQSDINQLKYLSLVIKETLRMYPATGVVPPRESRERCEIDGYEIPKGTKVIVNSWAIGRDPDFWTNPDRFEPERFENLSIDYKGHNFEYIPFGAGRRICPGLLFGIANIELPLAKLLYHFDWKLPNGLKAEELDMTEVFGATISRKVNLSLIPTIYNPLLTVET